MTWLSNVERVAPTWPSGRWRPAARVVARTQLLRLGVGRGAIAHRIERGRPYPLPRGVCVDGRRARRGPVAVLSHRSAAALWGMRGTAGGQAESPASLADLTARYPRCPGFPAIRALLGEHSLGDTITRSELEDRFLGPHRCRGPAPTARERQARAAAAPPRSRLTSHGRATASSSSSTASPPTPRAAGSSATAPVTAALQAAGWRVVRITRRQLHDSAGEVAADLETLLKHEPVSANAPTPDIGSRRTRDSDPRPTRPA
jgi:hypothetical protein